MIIICEILKNNKVPIRYNIVIDQNPKIDKKNRRDGMFN